MFEAQVLYLLRKYLGEYVEGLSSEALRISVWKGDVILKDLKLKAEALNALSLPLIVKAGFVGTITLKVPWKSLGKEPVIVLLDRVFLLANPAPDGQTLKEEDREKIFQSKLRDIQEAETETLEAARRSKAGTTPGGSSWLANLISTIIGNLKVTISNVHIRYEDNISNPGHPFCTGFTLSKLAAFTIDDQGNETFDTSGALDKLRKSVQLQRLALYHDSDIKPWTLDKRWEDLTPNEWTEIFQEGIHEDSSHGISVWAANHKYLVSPISGVLKYQRLGKQEQLDPEIPFEKALLVLSDVSLTVTESQYYDGIKLLEAFSRYKTRVEVSHLRPLVSVSENRGAWWRYAMLAGLQQKKFCYWFSWDRIKHLCHLRRRYVHLYVASLQQNSDVDISEIRQIERNLESKVIVLWRLLAHAKFESVKKRVTTKKSWWPFGWNITGDAPDGSNQTNSEFDNLTEYQSDEEKKLTKDEWKAINEILIYQPDEDGTSLLGKDLQNMIHYLVDISVAKAAARIVNINDIEVICGRFEQLHVSSKLYPKSVHCDVSLKFCGLSSPEGSLAESVISKRKTNALEATFILAPIEEDLDWRLVANIAPCHVTVLMDSYVRFLDFMNRSNAVSPTVTMETATVLQIQIEKVTRKAQEQFQMVLEDQSRFALDIDLDAPKIRIPFRTSGSTSKDCQFLLDFGHFTLHTREVSRDEERQSLYSRFLISGRDMAAFFRDDFDEEREYLTPKVDSQPSSLFSCLEDGDQFYSLLDRCGMSVVVDQIKVPHPSHPETRIAIQVPNLGLHFSPERYCRILYLTEILCGAKRSNEQNFDGCQQPGHILWHPVDLAADARILVWRGLGNSLAKWQPCHVVLSGLYLYVLESEASHSYRRYSSMVGKQVHDVSVGGSAYAVAVSYRGVDIKKALESNTTVIIEFNSYEEKTIWTKELVQATYRASAPTSMDILGDSINTLPESSGPQIGNFGSANLVINGSLVETKLSIYGKLGRNWGSNKESSILELVASGGKINLAQSGSDLTVKMKLHALKIKDELQSRLSNSPQYLACSVLNDKLKVVGGSAADPAVDELQPCSEEDDCFNDALSDFVSTPDHYSQSHESSYNPFSTEIAENILIKDKNDVSVTDNGQLNLKVGEIFYEAHDSSISDFVAVTFMTRNPDSPQYDGIDAQMSIGMSSLEFFCNRPTLVALIELGLDLSLVNSGSNVKDSLYVLPNDSKADLLPTDSKATDKEESGRALIKGLLGYGKGRVVFNLRMDVDSVHVFLNKEDGSQLAVFVQESFFLDLKVHPSSVSIEGTLGNMRLCDMSLGPDSKWGWLCDTRNQGIESLIKFTFQSYSVDDDDYQGYDYSLTGHLSAVRIVFLYRFVQEITSYFMELASPHTEEVIKFVDKLGGFESLIKKYEMDGATAVKLDLSLDTPIIIIPKISTSGDYMQLDLGHLQVNNCLSWHGSKEDDPSAVHLDTIHADINGINMSIGLNGVLGKPMIRDGKGIHIEVRRSLRDVFHKVPTLAFKFQIGFLHCIMSDKEYDVIINCIFMNLSEPPNLPPSFRGNLDGMKDSMRMLTDKVTLNGQMLLSRTIMIMAVKVHYALIELCNGSDDESPLAQIALEDIWMSYRTTSLSEVDLYATITKLSVFDLRPDTKAEMRLMLGSYADICKPETNRAFASTSLVSPFFDSSFNKVENSNEMAFSNLTMFIMDWRRRSSFQSLVIRIQQPQILVVLDFLLAVAEFFVPSLGSITGRGEILIPKNDPLTNSDDIVLSESIYYQRDDVVQLSPKRQLIVDGWGVDEFIYDGCGRILSLKEEFYVKGQFYTGNVIIVGRGKKLRFRNVKIENGALLRKCTYLNNGSSYSVSQDDGVEIMYFESSARGSDNQGSVECQESKEGLKVSEKDAHPASNQPYSFTFEAQMISPDFTFYDSSRLLSDDSVNFEKLLRAKMDISFMYASKDKDTWARSLVKDLTVEAGSGLIILEPVDISAGYTCVKEKTNISLLSTNLCINISLSVASLLLKLQNQAFSALQFGNVNPLTCCTNFKRIWVSPKGHGSLPGYNLTFWRPQAPTNYAILGDCVTSRSVPPSSVVVAVSNVYGRVRKPLGFKFLGYVSSFEESEGNVQRNNDCSIWMPIPPPGYSAVGCVAHIGDEPPPYHVVYCLRSDLATSASFSDCLFYIPPNSRVSRGFSIWRVDNAVGSFFAQCSVNYPPNQEIFDLHQVLLQRPDCYLSTNHLSLGTTVGSKPKGQQGENNNSGSSGWDILRSSSRTTAYYMSTPHFERIWWDKGFDQRRPISIWRPIIRPGFAILGDCITEGLEPPALGLIFKCDDPAFSAKPVQFTKVAHVAGKDFDQAFFWYPIAPPGYAAIGCVVTRMDEVPEKNFICCPRIDLVSQANVSSEPISRSSISKGSNCWSIWEVENQACTFLACSDLMRPSSHLAYSLINNAKPKVPDNITAEMKLTSLSLRVLDGIFGTMTPLLDATIMDINIATHGRLEAMNAVLICSIAASTFNRQLESWEPLIEPFDGILKIETYDTSKHPPQKISKRVSFAANSAVNLNASAAHLDILAETITSWDRQNDFLKKCEEAGHNLGRSTELTSSALNDEDIQEVIIENKIGCDVYLRKVDVDNLQLLGSDRPVSLLIPPPQFSDKLNAVRRSAETRFYVVIKISESKGLPIVDDGNSQEFFCALRLLVNSQVSDQYKLFPQSARTRCVRPSMTKVNDLVKGDAEWNEVFIFEVPEKGFVNLEVEITNLGLKAGKGEVIGAVSIPIDVGASSLKRASSLKVLQQASDGQQMKYSLRRKMHGQIIDSEEKDCGVLLISTSYLKRSAEINIKQMNVGSSPDRDVGFWVGLGPEGPWVSISAVLPLSVVPITLDRNPIALEIVMKNGKKHVILRSLALVVNDTDIKLEVSLCPAAVLNSQALSIGTSSSAYFTEEVFENQRYLPISGWGNKSSSANDPEHWSSRDFSLSSKDFFEPALPDGWKWSSAWKIEKSLFVDNEGWAYGTDFQSLKWPPSSSRSSSKLTSDFVRRRRWIRTRQQLPHKVVEDTKKFLTSIDPGSSTYLSCACMIKDSEMCLQVRPYIERCDEHYTWGQLVTFGSGKEQSYNQNPSASRQNSLKHSEISLQNTILRLDQLEKKDVLLYCNPRSNNKQYFWLCVGTDCSVLQTEFNTPVYDWRISLNTILRLENKLPYDAEYAAWEKTSEGNFVERQHGVVPSGGSAAIYSVDVRKPVYLTMFIQGSWVMEKDPILILDLVGLEHASSFWIIQQQTSRRLQVSVEHDMGETNGAPKIVRFFVPYWIQNDSLLPLSYWIMEMAVDSQDSDSVLISRAVKSAKDAVKHSSKSFARRNSSMKRNLQLLEVIEDIGAKCVMLSPQDYINQNVILPFQPRGNNFISSRVGISAAVYHSENYAHGISLLELENKEQVDFNAYTYDGSFYKLSAQLKMTSNRTKVVSIIPRTLFINRIGQSICLSQFHYETEQWIHPTDGPKLFKWQSGAINELLKLRLSGYKWSTPFSITTNGIIWASMHHEQNKDQMFVKVQVRGATKSSRYEVIFCLASLTSPYRIENRSLFLTVRVRQVDSTDDSWQILLPNSAAPFFWQDLGRQRLLEILVDGTDSSKYNIDEVMNHHPILESNGPSKALRLSVHKEGKTLVSRISDWMPENETQEYLPQNVPLSMFQASELLCQQSSETDSEFHVNIELSDLGLSIIDHMPEEILYLSVQNLLVSYSSGLGSGISRFKMWMQEIQVDNQLPFSPMPVLFRAQTSGDQMDSILKFSMSMQADNSVDYCVYPYIGLQVLDNSVFLVNIHEPILWRLHEMFQQRKQYKVLTSSNTAVSVDSTIKIGILNISEIRFKVSLAMSPAQRPRGVLGFWSSLMTALGNTEHMPVYIAHRFCEDVCMSQSALMSIALSNIKKDLLSRPLQLLSGVDILGNASSALSNMSKGVAALSMDKKFIQSRQKQDSKGVEDIGDVIREGGGALAKGLFRGFTGILTKPLEGAKTSGVEGFVSGVGKGLIGIAAQPVSGVLDLLSKTTEGANTVRMKISSAITSEEQLLRRRLPRAIGGDNLLRPYDDYKAKGQAILQLAESGTFFGQVDLFKVRGKFAFSDAYEDHFLLPKGKVVVVTHRRVLLLQQPTHIIAQRKFNPSRDACSVLWDVLWGDLATMELAHSKKDHQNSPPSRLILYLQMKLESREPVRVIKCSRGSQQAFDIYSSIQQALDTYGPNASKDLQKRKVPSPYSPSAAVFSKGVLSNEIFGNQGSIPMDIMFDTVVAQNQQS